MPCDRLLLMGHEATQTEIILSAAADPTRFSILQCLQSDSFSVSELCEILGMKQPAVSHHLKLLLEARLIAVQREGATSFYRRAGAAHFEQRAPLVSALFSSIDEEQTPGHLESGIAGVKQERSRRAREFFNRHRDALLETQELIAAPEQYLPVVLEMVHRSFTGEQNGTALEIGAGRGGLIPALLEQFASVVVVDVAEEMLQLAQQSVPQGEEKRVALFHGDCGAARQAGVRANLILCAMVLHHVPSPADIFTDCRVILQPGGSLIIADLCRHEQNWAIERCGDMWLGFDPGELSGFAQRAGYREEDSVYFGLRNGFQVQVRRFRVPESNRM